MPIENELLPATFRGVPFVVIANTQVGGRKTATHEYPNQTARYVEDLGGLLGRFSVRGVINNSTGLNDYTIRKLALETVLNLPGSGILTYGFNIIKRVAVISFNISETQTDLGRGIVDIEFEETTANIFPIFGGENVGVIADLVDFASAAINGEMSSVVKLRPQNFHDIAGKQEELHSVLSTPLPSPATVNQDSFNDFSNKLDNYYNDRFEASQDTQRLADNTTDLLASYNAISDDQAYMYELMRDLYDGYGIDDNDVISDALYMQERRTNRNILNASIKGLALTYMFLSAAKIIYNDSEDLKKIQDDLNIRFEEESASNSLTESVWASLENIKFKTFKFFGQLKVSKVTETKITRHTLTTLLYDYYEGFDNEADIIKLNNILNPTRLVGDAKLVTIYE